MRILLIFHVGEAGCNPCTRFPKQNELPGVTGALRRVPAGTALLARDFTSSHPWLTGVWSRDQPGQSILLGLSVHATAIKESAVTLTARGRGGAVCLQLVLPTLLWSGAEGSGERRLLVQSWPKTNSEELIKRRGRSRGKQAGRGKRVSEGRAASEEEATCRGSREQSWQAYGKGGDPKRRWGPARRALKARKRCHRRRAVATEVPAEACRAALREGASVHRIEEEVAKVQNGTSRTDAGREGRYILSPWHRGGEEGRDAGGRASEAEGRGNPGTRAQGWWGSPQHWPCHVAQDVGPDDYSCFPQLLFPILLQLLLKSLLQENLTPRGGVSINTKRGKKSVPGRAGRFHPRLTSAERARRPAARAGLGVSPRGGRGARSTGRKFCSDGSQTLRPTPASLTLWSRLKREGGRERRKEGKRREEEESLGLRLPLTLSQPTAFPAQASTSLQRAPIPAGRIQHFATKLLRVSRKERSDTFLDSGKQP